MNIQERVDWLYMKAAAFNRRGNTILANELIDTAELLEYLGGLSDIYPKKEQDSGRP